MFYIYIYIYIEVYTFLINSQHVVYKTSLLLGLINSNYLLLYEYVYIFHCHLYTKDQGSLTSGM